LSTVREEARTASVKGRRRRNKTYKRGGKTACPTERAMLQETLGPTAWNHALLRADANGHKRERGRGVTDYFGSSNDIVTDCAKRRGLGAWGRLKKAHRGKRKGSHRFSNLIRRQGKARSGRMVYITARRVEKKLPRIKILQEKRKDLTRYPKPNTHMQESTQQRR